MVRSAVSGEPGVKWTSSAIGAMGETRDSSANCAYRHSLSRRFRTVSVPSNRPILCEATRSMRK